MKHSATNPQKRPGGSPHFDRLHGVCGSLGASNCSDGIAIKRWRTENFKSYRMMSRFTKIAHRITCKSSSKRRPHRQHLTHLANFFDSSETLLAINLVPASADPCGVGVKQPAHPHLYLPRSGRRSQSRKFPFRHWPRHNPPPKRSRANFSTNLFTFPILFSSLCSCCWLERRI